MIKISHAKRQTKKYPICNDPAPRNNGLGMEYAYQSRTAEIKIEDLLNTEYALENFSMFIYDKKERKYSSLKVMRCAHSCPPPSNWQFRCFFSKHHSSSRCATLQYFSSFPSWNTFFPLQEILLSVLRPTLFHSCSLVFKVVCSLQSVRQCCKLSGIQRTKSPASPAPKVLVVWFKKQELNEMWFTMQGSKGNVERAFMLHL